MTLEFEQGSDLIRFFPGKQAGGHLGAGELSWGPGEGGPGLSSGWDREDAEGGWAPGT